MALICVFFGSVLGMFAGSFSYFWAGHDLFHALAVWSLTGLFVSSALIGMAVAFNVMAQAKLRLSKNHFKEQRVQL